MTDVAGSFDSEPYKRPEGGQTMSDTKGIYEKLAAIQAEIGNIPKNGTMSFGGTSYQFVKADDITEKVHELLVKYGVITRPEVEVTREIREAGNRHLTFNLVKLTTTFIDSEDGSEYPVVAYGESGEIGDKGLRKAVTQASKVTNLLTFNIATGEVDPDAQQPNLPTDKDYQKSAPAAPVKKTPAQEVQDEKASIGATYVTNGNYTSSQLNALAEKVTGKPATGEKNWSNMADLKKIRKALEAGEVA